MHFNASHAVHTLYHSIVTNNKVNFVLLLLKDFIYCCCNNNNKNMDIAGIIAEVENSSDLIQHYLAAGNSCADSEFDNSSVIK